VKPLELSVGDATVTVTLESSIMILEASFDNHNVFIAMARVVDGFLNKLFLCH
jgi:hypothetical protein